MLEKLPDYEKQLADIDEKLSNPETMQDMKLFRSLNQERSHLAPIIDELKEMKRLKEQIADAKQLLKEEKDSEMLELTEQELDELTAQLAKSEQKTKMLLIPPDPMEGKDIIMEIRAGTGGEEAALFAANLFRMYSHYADTKGWKIEVLSSNETGIGGYKELVLSISGKDVYGSLRFESGVHRVQRVPETESGGRIHTSAVTVAVLPEAEETDIEIRQEELKVDVMRAGGPGGQSVNTTDSAVRLTHLPTGLVVICQDEKSQIKNKAKALRVLRSRLFDLEEEKKNRERAEARKSQVGSGDRSERIRTYNFPQNRLTDHRINLTLYKLELIMAGDLDEVIEALKIAAGEAALKEA
ncbi:peptide chain release factor 1 [Sphaerochaeta halotolerans]|jgi:peptide chain release factor 1|uniref:peptide chain release factor 1 n=1 Tax=Sphaerochaeta halotolerans TaxID=2293840 RepID=UPI00136CBB29|nr:peptide chain release factor 1 [Sphaerochaeta halotolerans]MBG0766463.1 peptide chain release factor 1 [Spirochaetaceae bacterium]MDK2860049.1 peptide chain release factor 1 [Sphaerochaeta sp.]MDN5333085.1 peptide chain release factor 1 [Sphaerochaeta sp.]MXI85412.1 peptide chain release factor 1 [Sphaerochaeta halotolerans]